MTDRNLHTDENYWVGLQNDDPLALAYLYDSYIDRLFLTASFFTNDRELAKDALQEVFINIWVYRKTLGQVRNTEAYLTKVLKRVLFKKQHLKPLLNITAYAESGTFAEQSVESTIISSDMEREKTSRLNTAISSLSHRQKLILHLRFNQGLSYDQIAEKLGMNYQSVNNLAFRTFKRLRSSMSSSILFFAVFFEIVAFR